LTGPAALALVLAGAVAVALAGAAALALAGAARRWTRHGLMATAR
jgi:hypothetical protein